MASTRRITESKKPSLRPASTPEGQETQYISMAMDLASKQLKDGTASAQVITHFLKLGSSREALEQKRLRGENELLNAKIKALESGEQIIELYSEALRAMREYSGQDVSGNDG